MQGHRRSSSTPVLTAATRDTRGVWRASWMTGRTMTGKSKTPSSLAGAARDEAVCGGVLASRSVSQATNMQAVAAGTGTGVATDLDGDFFDFEQQKLRSMGNKHRPARSFPPSSPSKSSHLRVRHLSASATLSLSYTCDPNLLKPPPRCYTRLPASTSTTTTTTTTTSGQARLSGLGAQHCAMAGSVERAGLVSGAPYIQEVGHFAPVESSTFPPRPLRASSQATTPVRRTQQQSTEDFVFRTDRSLAREQQQRRLPSRQQKSSMSTLALVREANSGLPRRLSDASQASAVSAVSTTTSSGEASDPSARVRSPSWSSHSSQSSATTAMSHTSTGSLVATDSKQPGSPTVSPQTASSNYPGQPQWRRPALIKTSRRRAAEGEIFAALPGEVLELILDQLKEIHLARGSDSCATCWMRDACSMAVAARKMLKYARVALYEDVQLVGADSAHQRKKLKPLQHGTRLALLRRTLRASPQIAAIVRSIKVPNPPKGGGSTDEYQNLVASVIMACPNLERVVGFYPTYDHASFKRYFHALSTRQRLKEMSWIIGPAPSSKETQQQQQARPRSRGGAQQRSLALMIHSQIVEAQQTPPPSPGPLSPFSSHFSSSQPPSQFRVPAPPPLEPEHSANFFELHVSWQYLTSLTVHCKAGATLAPDTLLIEALTCLPALQNLHLSHIPHTSFSDATLLGLPPLKKLSLVHVAGVSSAGLSMFASRGNSRSLVSLSLVHVNVDSLQALARILSKLTLLTSFSLVQMYPPTLAPGEVIWLFPYLASATLRRLHWDVPTYANRANAADMALARSIAADGFPSLRTLRAPSDPEGVFQALCRPQLRADLPADRLRAANEQQDAPLPSPFSRHGRGDSASSSSSSSFFSRPFGGGGGSGSSSSTVGSSTGGSSTGSSHSRSDSNTSYSLAGTASPTSPAFAPQECLLPQLYSDLYEARRLAQRRIEAAKQAPRFIVNVRNDSGALVENHAVGAFLGTVHSRITYHLLPDEGATDDKGGLLDMDDLLADGGEADQAAAPDGCTGRWNANWEVSQKKDKERWWHTERGRWRAVTLS